MVRKLVGALLFSQSAIGQEIRNLDRAQKHLSIEEAYARVQEFNQQQNSMYMSFITRENINDYLDNQEKEMASANKNPRPRPNKKDI